MSVSPALSTPHILIFDTGPLWELVLYSVVHRLKYASLRGELLHLKNASSYNRLSNFIAGFARKTTTPHVVAEVSFRIVRTEPKTGHSAVWGVVYTEFRAMRMDEDIMKLLGMPQELVADFGAVDASVLQLGLELGRAKTLVLSIDNSLVSECKRIGLNAKHLWEVIA